MYGMSGKLSLKYLLYVFDNIPPTQVNISHTMLSGIIAGRTRVSESMSGLVHT
jgi:hypothetical protein